MFPRAALLSIAVTASEDAECLDIENGDAAIIDAPGWHARQRARGVPRPALYCSASNVGYLVTALTVAAIPRGLYRLWSAHYGEGAHICGPHSCGYIDPGGHPIPECDGTQFTNEALGRTLDQSLLAADFFTGPPPKETDVPGIWKQIITITPTATGWTVAGIGEDGALWATTRTGATWSKPQRIGTADIKP